MEKPTIVSHTIGHVGGLPSPPSSQQGSDHSNTPRDCVPAMSPQLATWLISGNASRRKKFLHHGDRSLKSYDSLFKKWINWCDQQHFDHVSGTHK